MRKKILITGLVIASSALYLNAQDSIFVGGMIEFTYNNYAKGQVETKPGNYPDENKALHDYRNWRHGYCDTCVTYNDWLINGASCTGCEAPGDTLTRKWIAGETLSNEDSLHLQIAKASYMWPSYVNKSYNNTTRPSDPADAFTWDVVRNGRSSLRKGYRGETLTSEDSADIGLYRIFIEMEHTGADRLPFQLDISSTNVWSLGPGATAPDFRGLKLDTLLRSPLYSDGITGNADLLGFLQYGSSSYFFDHFEGYEADGPLNAKERFLSAGTDSNFIHLSEYIRVHQKPVVLFIASSRDVFWPRCYRMTEHLKMAYGDKIDFLFVDCEIHDAHMSPPEYFGPTAGSDQRTTWAVTAENRAKITKIRAMETPWSTIPVIVDGVQERIANLYSAQGGDGFFLLIDKNGKIAYQMHEGWNQFSPNGAAYSDDVLWTNLLEQYIIKLIRNEGLYDPQATFPWPLASKTSSIPDRMTERDARWGGFPWSQLGADKLWKMANIVSYDTIGHEITFRQYDYASFEDKMIGYALNKAASGSESLYGRGANSMNELKNWLANTDSLSRIFTFKIDNGVELFVNGEEVLDEKSFREGDFVNIRYDFNTASEYPLHVRASRFNFAPTIDSVDDQFITENDPEQLLLLTGLSDGNLACDQLLTIKTESSNIDLIPDPVIVKISSDTAYLKFTPAADQRGTTTITLMISDDGGMQFGGIDSTLISFQIHVLPEGGGNLPSLDPIDDIMVLEDAAETSITLTGVSDGDGGFDLDTLIASSSDASLIPDPMITYTEGEDNAQLSFTPVAGLSGNAVITVNILDNDGLTTTREFGISVTPVNDPPTIDAVSDVVIDQDAGEQSIVLTGISDGDDGQQVLTLTAECDNETLISEYDITYVQGESSAEFTYQSNAGQYGEASIVVTLNDDGGTDNMGNDQSSITFRITVNSTGSSVKSTRAEGDISIFPNPACSEIIITTGSFVRSVMIYSLAGVLLYQSKPEKKLRNEPVDVSTFENGIYIIHLVTNDETFTEKFSKMAGN